MPVQTVIKLRRDTAANWASTNPVLAAGEAGLETDSTLVKFGDGTTTWTSLEYASTASIRTKVLNQTGSPITKGSVVYITGANGDNPTITLADADTEATSSKTLGLVDATIANGAIGYVIEAGLITGLNTASATAGQSVWLSSTAGQFVYGAPPAKPAHSVYLGVVIRAQTNNGSILVKVQNGYELNELHDVNAGSPTTGQVLQWNGTAWVNATVDALPSQSGQNGKYLTTDGSTASWGTITIPPGTAVSDTAPSSPATGQLWWESDTGILYIYYDNFWVEAVAGIVGPQGDPGVIQSTSAPSDTTVLWIDTDDAGDMVVPAGGTTGQALVKASATDYDTTWAGPYATSPNFIINGAFDFWQRGTSFAQTSTVIYGADRWGFYRGGFATGATTSRQTATLDNFQFAARVQRDSGNTSTAGMNFTQPFETSEIIRLRGQAVTISFWARAGANFSSASSELTSIFDAGTGTDQTGWVGFTSPISYSQASTITTSWQRFTHTFTLGADRTSGALRFGFNPVGTAGANDWFEITGVQLEAGSVATPFKRNANTLQGELAACQRYYEKSYNLDVAPGTNTAVGVAELFGSTDGSNNLAISVDFKVTKRATPTISVYTAGGTINQWAYARNGASGNVSATVDRESNKGFRAYLNAGSSWVVANGGGHWVASSEL